MDEIAISASSFIARNFGLLTSVIIFLNLFFLFALGWFAYRKFISFSQIYNSVVIAKAKEDGHESFSGTLVRHEKMLQDHDIRLGLHDRHFDAIDTRCERRIEQAAYSGEDRRKK